MTTLTTTNSPALVAGIFQPQLESGLKGWYKTPFGVFTDSAKDTKASAEDDLVYTWRDESGNGNDMVQATEGSRPDVDLINPAFGNHTTLHFDGTNAMVAAWGETITQPFTVFWVASSDANDTNDRTFIDGNATGARHTVRVQTDGSLLMWANGSNLTGGAPSTTPHYYTALFNGASSTLHMDGTLIDTVDVGAHSSTGLTIGRKWDSGLDLVGDFAELLFYDGDKTGGQFQTFTERYLRDKFNL